MNKREKPHSQSDRTHWRQKRVKDPPKPDLEQIGYTDNCLAWINCGSWEEVHLVYMSLYHYVFGQVNALPKIVINLIKSNASRLPLKTLWGIDSYLSIASRLYDIRYRDLNIEETNYGSECYRQIWLDFHKWVKEQIETKWVKEQIETFEKK